MKSNRGFINIDFGAIFVALLVIGALIGAVTWSLVQWLWPLFRAWLHTATA